MGTIPCQPSPHTGPAESRTGPLCPLLSVAIITLNEERNLARTLASVGFADEIVIVDSGSTDGTVAIAESFGARVFHREPWPGFAAAEKLRYRPMLPATGSSRSTPTKSSHPNSAPRCTLLLPATRPSDAYYLKRRNLFLNRWIKHGGFYPDPKLRLFRRTAANFSTSAQV